MSHKAENPIGKGEDVIGLIGIWLACGPESTSAGRTEAAERD